MLNNMSKKRFSIFVIILYAESESMGACTFEDDCIFYGLYFFTRSSNDTIFKSKFYIRLKFNLFIYKIYEENRKPIHI